MELAVLTIFGVGAWWAVAVGDSDEENEFEAAGGVTGRRREVVDVTADRRLRAHEAMVRVPKPGYLIVKADIIKGSDATDEMLEMCPAVQKAWTERVVESKKKEREQRLSKNDEEKLELRSVFDDISDWVKERVSKESPNKRNQVRPFDYGALIMGDEPKNPTPSPKNSSSEYSGGGGGGGGGGSGGARGVSDRSLAFDQNPSTDAPTKKQGSCVICFDENPKYRACFLPCGHASMCYGCALDAAITQSGACPMCRTRLAVIATYDPLELVQIPSSELDALKHRIPKHRTPRAAEDTGVGPSAEEVDDSKPSESVPSGSFEALLSTGQSMNEVMSIIPEVETELCWVARVNGPKGVIIEYLTVDDLKRRM